MAAHTLRSRLRRVLELYTTLLRGICRVTTVLTGCALVVLTVIFGWLVFGRYVLNATPTWVEQVALLLVAYITFLSAAIGVYENTHLSVAFFRERSPRIVRNAFAFISHIAMTLFGVIMTMAGFELTEFKWGTQIPLLDVPEGLRAIPLVVGGALIALFSVAHLAGLLLDGDNAPSGGA